jgi:hypothetical protein
MTLEQVKEKLLMKIGTSIGQETKDDDCHYYATVYDILCRAETQTKMTAHAIAECENPFKETFDD